MIQQRLEPVGWFNVEHVRDGKVIGKHRIPNGITIVGKNHMFNATFNLATATNLWYAGLLDNGSFTGVSESDTMVSHAGWLEYQNYTGARKAWGQGTAAAKAITNASAFTFTFATSSGTVQGIFIIGTTSTKGATTGVLWSTALFPAPLAVQVGDVLNVTYTVNC